MKLLNLILLSFIAVTTSVTCLFVLMFFIRDYKDRSRLIKDSKIETIRRACQDFNSSCSQLLEVANGLRGKLSTIERIARNEARNMDANCDREKLQQEILSTQSLVEKLSRSYVEFYLPASVQIFKQTNEVISIHDQDLSKLFNELVLLDERLQGIWQNIERMYMIEKVKVLLAQFNRTSNYLYLLRETSQQITNRTICLGNTG
jgi:hypothetical protein